MGLRGRCASIAFLAALAAGVGSAAAESVKIPSMTLETASFLRGAGDGKRVVLTGELEVPRGVGERVPAVVLLHGAGGVQDYHDIWARELRSVGAATLIVDSFSGRGLARIPDNLEALSVAARIPDLFAALGVLAADPRIDRERIAFMGFSHGATAGIYAVRRRFEKAYGPPDATYALWLLFYPYCNSRFLGDDALSLSARPIRLFHGSADDWTPIGPCRDFVDRGRSAGADIAIKEYANAHHGFDNPRQAQLVRIPSAMNPSQCFFVEGEGGVALNSATGKPMTYRDACWTRGVSAGYEPSAYADALASVKELVRALARATR